MVRGNILARDVLTEPSLVEYAGLVLFRRVDVVSR